MSKKCILIGFVFGISVGVLLSTIYYFNATTYEPINVKRSFSNENDDFVFNEELINNMQISSLNNSIAENLHKNVTILCWILTSSDSKKPAGIHVKNTWGKRCNKLVFFSSTPNSNLDVVILKKRTTDWRQTREALRYLYIHHFNDSDWFYKANDDTYSIMENLRYMLYEYDPNVPIFFALKFKYKFGRRKRIYMTSHGGFVISKEALRRFANYGYFNTTICPNDMHRADNYLMKQCWQDLGVYAGDTRDSLKRSRFHPLGLETPILKSYKLNDPNYKFWKFIYSNSNDSLAAVSDHLVAFYYIKPTDMYTLEYFVYYLRPYGYYRGFGQLPKKKTVNETIQALQNNNNNLAFM